MALLSCGIDLGTTFSSIAISEDQQVKIIPNEYRKKTTPSIVSFEGDKIYVGEKAKNRACKNLDGTVCGAKRLIGHKFSEEGVQKDLHNWGFKVEKDENEGGCFIDVSKDSENYKVKPHEISSHVLNYLGESLRRETGEKNKTIHAVITVPAYFNSDQRRATIEAGELAGLNVLQIINEPTAAALAYGSQFFKDNKDRKILIYDFGGGTFDVSIIEMHDEKITVKATGGDDHLGGEDIVNNMVDYYIERLKEVDSTRIIGAKELYQLRKACDEAKINLSESGVIKVIVDCDLLSDNEISTELKRDDFEKMNENTFKRTIKIVDEVLNDSGLSKNEIDNVVLVGGSSRIPKVQELLSKFFGGKKLNKDINPDEAVAYGAAILAEDILLGVREERDDEGNIKLIDTKTGGVLNPEDKVFKYIEANKLVERGRKILVPNSGGGRKVLVTNGNKKPVKRAAGRKVEMEDVLSHSIGIGLKGDRYSIIIRKGTIITDETHTERYCTADDNQTGIRMIFYQGEDPVASKNKPIVNRHIRDVVPKPEGEVKFDVEMKINDNGVINVNYNPKNEGDFRKDSFDIRIGRMNL